MTFTFAYFKETQESFDRFLLRFKDFGLPFEKIEWELDSHFSRCFTAFNHGSDLEIIAWLKNKKVVSPFNYFYFYEDALEQGRLSGWPASSRALMLQVNGGHLVSYRSVNSYPSLEKIYKDSQITVEVKLANLFITQLPDFLF